MELEQIKKSILEIRGKKVMLDMDLAIIYEVETRVLKQAFRRNIDRFPSDFFVWIERTWNAKLGVTICDTHIETLWRSKTFRLYRVRNHFVIKRFENRLYLIQGVKDGSILFQDKFIKQ